MGRKARRDVVTLEVRQAVLGRDGYRCMAPELDRVAAGCRDNYGNDMAYPGGYHVARLELHHVKDQPRMGVRAESDPDHLITLCPWHHKFSGWATSRTGLTMAREYLRRKAGAISNPATGTASGAPDVVQLAFPKKGPRQ